MRQKPESRTERKKEETQKKIITTAVGLFNQYGIEAVTMEQIAAEADIAKGTLYHYFPFKEAILNAFLQRTFQERSSDRLAQLRSLPDTRTRLVRIFHILLEGVQAQKQIFEAFMVYRMKQILSFKPVAEGEQTGLSLLVKEIIALGRQSCELRADLPDDLVADLFEFALIESIKPFYLEAENFNLDQSIEQCVDLFLNGVRA